MDSVLELDTHEITRLKETLIEHKDLFKQNSQALFSDCFLMLTSTGAKQDNFALLSTITETEGLSTVFDVVLNLCALVFKLNVKGAEEFQLILDDLGLKGKNGEGAQQSFAKYLQRVENLNAVTEDEDAAMTMKVDKKFPLNM